MFSPSNHRMTPLEAELGQEHQLYDWRGDTTLRARWQMMLEACKEKGWSQRETVAAYHWVMLAGKGRKVEIKAADSWKSRALPCRTGERYSKPIVVVAVHLIDRLSQYVGWISPEDFLQVPIVNWSHQPEKYKVMRRVVLQSHLRMGFPPEQQELFTKDTG